MTTPENIIRVHQDGQTATFKVEGRGTMQQSSPLRRHADECLTRGTMRIHVDLRACTYMDSTFLGTLIILHKQMSERKGRFSLLAPSPNCMKLLRQMGLHDYLQEEPDATCPETGWIDLPGTISDSQTFRRTVEQAHQELARLPGEAGEQFQEALRCMNRTPPSPPPPGTDKPARP